MGVLHVLGYINVYWKLNVTFDRVLRGRIYVYFDMPFFLSSVFLSID